MGRNSGKKGNQKNDGPTAGKRSKKGGSDDASSRKTRDEVINKEKSGRTNEQKVGVSKGNEDKVGGNLNATGSRGETALGMRVGS